MQQIAQIVDIKDRLVHALDEQLNIQDINEVKRVLSILEHTHVTQEALQKTRLGKLINDLRKRSTDDEVSKRSRKLIKSWQKLLKADQNTNANPTYDDQCSPALVNGISPYSLSNDTFANYYANSYAPASNGRGEVINGNCRDAKLAGVGGTNSSTNGHPALMRVKGQYTPKLVSPQERTKPASAASPRLESLSARVSPALTNGHHSGAGRKFSLSHSNLTSPINASNYGQNGLSPGLRNSFKNILDKDGRNNISPNTRRRTTPPAPINGGPSLSLSNQQQKNSSLLAYSDSTSSSRHCSPLAFTFSNDSRDSMHSNVSGGRNYSSREDFSPGGGIDTADEDSNSSVFFNAENGAASLTNGQSEQSKSNRKGGRKRKADYEHDSLRENLNSILNSGGRLQSTQELVQKFNINLANKSQANSLSATSSPQLLDQHQGSAAKRSKHSSSRNGHNGGYNYNNDENSLSDYESAILHHNNKSLPASPALASLRGASSHSASTSPAFVHHHHRFARQEQLQQDEQESDRQFYSKTAKLSDKLPDSSTLYETAKTNNSLRQTLSKRDLEIMQIYAKLPPINPEDIELMKNFKFDTGETVEEEEEEEEPKLVNVVEQQKELSGDENDYELFEYDEEYETETDEEVEVTDDEPYEEEEQEEEAAAAVVSDNDDDDRDRSKAEASSDVASDLVCHQANDQQQQNLRDDETTSEDLKCLQSSQSQSRTGESQLQPTGDNFHCDINSEDEAMRQASTVDSDQHWSPSMTSSSIVKSDSSQSFNSALSASPTTEQQQKSFELINATTSDSDTTTTTHQPNDIELIQSCSGVEQNDIVSWSLNHKDDQKSFNNGQSSSRATSPNLLSAYPLEDYLADLAVLSYDPIMPKYDPLPELIVYTPTQVDTQNSAVTQEESKSLNEPNSVENDNKCSPPNNNNNTDMPSSMDISNNNNKRTTPNSSDSSDNSDQDDDDDEEEDHDDQEIPFEEENDREESPIPAMYILPPKRTKKVIKRVRKKKYRKCVGRSRIKRSIVDRLCYDQWEGRNGNYDHDGVWRHLGEMTSAYVLRKGANSPSKDPDNVLLILPYVNYSW